MDQLKNQNVETLTHNIKVHYYLVKLTQLFVSVSLCSFIFSPSSLLVFFHYFKFYFSTFPFQLYTHNIDKNCMFLLCNGLLVFVGITKSLSGSSCDDDKPSTYVKDGSHSQFSAIEANELMLEIVETGENTSEHNEQNIAAEQVIEIENCAEEVQGNIEKIILVDEGQEKGNSLVLKEEEKELDEVTELLDADDEEEDKGSEFDYFLIEDRMEEEEENVEEENCALSTEELNRKVEDFIRKMKEDLRIEAQRQLVMV
ncbi:hypothetical protein Fmac_030530 [Flemingia macrophylla]|uniref:Uncharacterized protein n=1 Tax=Flemingia macrophylla TaxID=520843 RepID=A0ABD1KZF7_9FABA